MISLPSDPIIPDRSPLGRLAPVEQQTNFRLWKLARARAEYRSYLNQLSVGEADAFRESPTRTELGGPGTLGRRRRYSEWIEMTLRTDPGWADAFSQMKAHLRRRWRLRDGCHIFG